MSDDLLKLAEWCEAATGPDRELDAAIQRTLGSGSAEHWFADFAGRWVTDDHAPAYTDSLDAALSLVPEGSRVAQLEENWRSGLWDCRVSQRPSAALIRAFDEGFVIGYDSDEAQGEAAVLALTAASLRARARSAA